jgi:GDP-L-fucose synthase
MRVFIAGHRGLVGGAVLRAKPAGVEVVVRGRSELQLNEKRAVCDFLKVNHIDAIILAAAKVGGIGQNSKDHKGFLLENLNIQNAVLGSASELGISKAVFLGSSCIYPKFASQPINEDSLLAGPLEETNEGYALAKIAGIRLCKAIHEQDGLNFFSLMPTNLYGQNDNFDKFASHVPAALMRKFHEAKINDEPEVTVWGTGTARREFMHVDDMARACWYMLDQNLGGELINIGTGEDVTISEFAELMAQVVGYEGKIVYDQSKPDGTPRKLLDVSKAHSLGWKHQIELEDGLRHTYAWLVDALAKGEVRGY